MRHVSGVVTVAVLAILAVACDSGPEGPGELTGALQVADEPVGALLLEVAGSGIEGFSGAGGARVFWEESQSADTYRVIVVGDGGGSPSFHVSVRDVGARKPRATVISVAGPDNLPRPVTQDYKVRFTR